jgi:hypothetical protein
LDLAPFHLCGPYGRCYRSFEITKDLVLGDVDDRVSFTGSTELQVSTCALTLESYLPSFSSQIRLTANYLEVDATLRTVTVDWFPQPLDCSSNPEMVVNLFVDP